MEGPTVVGGQELDGEEIEHASPEAAAAELRVAVEAVAVVDVDLGDPETGPGCKHGDVAVELTVEVELVGHGPPHQFETAVEVGAVNAADCGGGPVVEPRRLAFDKAVVAVGAATGDEVVAGAQ